MVTHTAGDESGTRSVRVTLPDEQVELLDDLSEIGGPCHDRSDAVRLVIDEFRQLAAEEPVDDDRE